MSHHQQIFDRLTKGDSYFLHQIRKNRRKQYTKRRNHSPYLINNNNNANNNKQPQDPRQKDRLPMINGQDMREEDDSVLIESPGNSEDGDHYPGEGTIVVGGDDHLDSFLDNLRNQNSTRQRLEEEREMQWKKQLAEQKERMDGWNDKLKERIAQVDKLKEEIRVQQQKHEQQLLEERSKMDKEYSTKNDQLAERETSLFALMEDIKIKLEQQAQAEKMLTLRFADVEHREKHADRRELEYKEKIEELKDTIQRQEMVIANNEKAMKEQESALDDAQERIDAFKETEEKLEQVELALHRATVEREKYATEREMALNKREESLQAFEDEITSQREKVEHHQQEMQERQQELQDREKELTTRLEDIDKQQDSLQKEMEDKKLDLEAVFKEKNNELIELKQEVNHKLQVAEEKHRDVLNTIEKEYKEQLLEAEKTHQEAIKAENDAKAALVAAKQQMEIEKKEQHDTLEKQFSQKLAEQQTELETIREEMEQQQQETVDAIEAARREAFMNGGTSDLTFKTSHHDLKLHKANMMTDLARKKQHQLAAKRTMKEATVRSPQLESGGMDIEVEEEDEEYEETLLQVIADGTYARAVSQQQGPPPQQELQEKHEQQEHHHHHYYNVDKSVHNHHHEAAHVAASVSSSPHSPSSANPRRQGQRSVVPPTKRTSSQQLEVVHSGSGMIDEDTPLPQDELPFSEEESHPRVVGKQHSNPMVHGSHHQGDEQGRFVEENHSPLRRQSSVIVPDASSDDFEKHLHQAAQVAGYSEKRITYISVMAGPLLKTREIREDEPYDPRSLDMEPDQDVLLDLIQKSGQHNSEHGITSILVTVKNMLIQVIEGETSLIDQTFGKIYKNALHEHIQIVRIEENIEERLYADSYMNFIPIRDPAASAFMNTLVKLKYDQDVIEQYICPPVLAQIKNMKNPLQARVLRYRRVVLMTRIHRFEEMENAIGSDLEEYTHMLNQYFNLVSRTVQDAGGQVVSFRNDEITCYFKEDDMMLSYETALLVLYRIHRCHSKLSDKSENNLKHIQIIASLAYGGTVEGSFGGPVMKTFELLGETVERARAMLNYNANSVTRSPFYLLMDEHIYNVARTHKSCGKHVGFVKNAIYQVASKLASSSVPVDDSTLDKKDGKSKKSKKSKKSVDVSLSSSEQVIHGFLTSSWNNASYQLLSDIPQFYVTTQYRKRRTICQFQKQIDDSIDAYIAKQVNLRKNKPALELHTQHGDAYSGGLSPSQLNNRRSSSRNTPNLFQEYLDTDSTSFSVAADADADLESGEIVDDDGVVDSVNVHSPPHQSSSPLVQSPS